MDDPTAPMQFASGFSTQPDTAAALDESLGAIESSLGEGATDLVVAFVSPHHTAEFSRVADRLHRQLHGRCIVAATAAGVIGAGREAERGAGIGVLAARLPSVDVQPFSLADMQWPNSDEDLGAWRQSLRPTDRLPTGVFFFADPFSTPMMKLLPAMNEALPQVPIMGGMCSGGASPGENRLLLDGELYREGAVGLSLSGSIRIDCTVSQGCRPIGRPLVITRARHNVIQELSGRNVFAVLREMAEQVEDADRALMRQGLLMGRVINEYQDSFSRGDFLIRNIVGADEKAGYIAVADLVRVGQTVQFHVRDAAAAEEDLTDLLKGQKEIGPAAGALLFTCNGRGSHLFGRADVEPKLIHQALPNLPMAGFFAAGEIGPIGGVNFIHGFTSCLAVFRRPNPEAAH